jgi:hypothetical protein
MPIHEFEPPRGRLESVTVDSHALRDNMLGDPSSRVVSVYLPDGYDESVQDFPLFVCLAGFTSSGLKKTAWQGFGQSVPQRLDRLIADGAMGPVVTAFPDCFTSLGGNQYINSAAMGNWEDYLLDEMLPLLEQRFRIRRGRDGRAVFGKSSGGYGALIHALKHGTRWRAAASHSGDVGWELVYLRDMPKALDVLARHDGDVERFLQHLREAIKIRGNEMYALMLLAMSATYDPDPASPLPSEVCSSTAAHATSTPCTTATARSYASSTLWPSSMSTKSSTTTTPTPTTAWTSPSRSSTTPSPPSRKKGTFRFSLQFLQSARFGAHFNRRTRD